jgi:hypothetical protein
VRSGHSHTRRLVAALFADPDAWRYTTLSRVTQRSRAEWQDGMRLAGD